MKGWLKVYSESFQRIKSKRQEDSRHPGLSGCRIPNHHRIFFFAPNPWLEKKGMVLMTTCPVPTHQASDRKWALQGPSAGSTLEALGTAGALNTEHIYMLLGIPGNSERAGKPPEDITLWLSMTKLWETTLECSLHRKMKQRALCSNPLQCQAWQIRCLEFSRLCSFSGKRPNPCAHNVLLTVLKP